MKKRDLLDLFEDIDPEIVSDAAPKPKNSKKTKAVFPYKKIIAAVACCVLILGGIIVAIPLFDSILHPDTHMGKGGETGKYESATETEIDSFPHGEVPPYVDEEKVVCNIDDVRYSGYSFEQLECSADLVGEKVGEVKVNLNNLAGELLYVGTADIYEIKGVDGDVTLCYNFTDAGGYCEENKYLYFPNYEMNYNSIADVLSKFSFGENMKIQSKCTYGDNTREHYYTRYDISTEQKEKLAEILMSESTAVEDMRFECDESVRFTLRGPNLEHGITFRVLDNGYVSVEIFKKYYFEIGIENAGEIIEIVKSGVPTEGYEWIEDESIWGTIDPNEYTPEIEMVSFHKYLEDLGLMNNLYLDGNARYSAMYSKNDREQINFVVGNVNRQLITEMLYSIDGNHMPIGDDVYKSVYLNYILGDGSKASIYITGNGYISIGRGSFFVGVDTVNQIFDIVYKQCQPSYGYYWNEKDQRWYKHAESETETDPIEESVIEIPDFPTEWEAWAEDESFWGTIYPDDNDPDFVFVEFQEYLDDLGLSDNISLSDYARYSVTYNQTDSEKMIVYLSNDIKQRILKILNVIDGYYYIPANDSSRVFVSLKYILEDGSEETIYITERGYISIGDGNFYFGPETVKQITDLVCKQGYPPTGYYWNEKDQRWYKHAESETETDIETESDSVEESVSEIVSEIPEKTVESETQPPEYSVTIATDGVKVYSHLQSDDGDDVRFFLITIPSLNNATLEYRKDYEVYLDGERLQDFAATSCDSFFLSDLTGDGCPELCLNVNVGFGMIDDRIVVVDLKAKKTIFTKADRSVNDYYLSLIDGVLHVTETDYRSREVNRTGVLAYNGSEVLIIWDGEEN